MERVQESHSAESFKVFYLCLNLMRFSLSNEISHTNLKNHRKKRFQITGKFYIKGQSLYINHHVPSKK